VPVPTQAENNHVKSAKLCQLPLVFLDTDIGVFDPTTERVKPLRWNAPSIGNIAAKQVGARTRVIDRHAKILVESE
jgi:hypothetical protein